MKIMMTMILYLLVNFTEKKRTYFPLKTFFTYQDHAIKLSGFITSGGGRERREGEHRGIKNFLEKSKDGEKNRSCIELAICGNHFMIV